jgi:hypothetical protein
LCIILNVHKQRDAGRSDSKPKTPTGAVAAINTAADVTGSTVTQPQTQAQLLAAIAALQHEVEQLKSNGNGYNSLQMDSSSSTGNSYEQMLHAIEAENARIHAEMQALASSTITADTR